MLLLVLFYTLRIQVFQCVLHVNVVPFLAVSYITILSCVCLMVNMWYNYYICTTDT